MSLEQIGMVRETIHVQSDEDIKEAIIKFLNNLNKDKYLRKLQFKRLHEGTMVELRISINILEVTP